MSDCIPFELISDILLRLPIADVLRFRPVCKSWNGMITSSSFISLHLNSSISNAESRVIVKCASKYGRNQYYYLHRDNQAFEEIHELEPPQNPNNANISIYGSSNGVFCCSSNTREKSIYGESLILWNPSIRKSLILPKSRDAPLSKHRQQHNVGFGFLPSSDNFKIVRVIYTHLSYRNFTFPPEAEIYDSFTRSWRNLDATKLEYVPEDDCGQALLNGIVHWTARDPHRVEGTSTYGGLIVSFDLTNEEFGTLMLPSCLQNGEDPSYFCVYTWKESLCLLHTGVQRGVFQSSVFILKEYDKTDSWEKLLNFDTVDFFPLYLRENGEFLARKMINGEEDIWKLVSCDPKTKKNMDIGVRKVGENALYLCNAYAYVDSLFLLK